MNKTVVQLPFPAKVLRGPGALHSLGRLCKTQGKRIFILGGNTALEKTRAIMTAGIAEAEAEIAAVEWYGGECSQENIQ